MQHIQLRAPSREEEIRLFQSEEVAGWLGIVPGWWQRGEEFPFERVAHLFSTDVSPTIFKEVLIRDVQNFPFSSSNITSQNPFPHTFDADLSATPGRRTQKSRRFWWKREPRRGAIAFWWTMTRTLSSPIAAPDIPPSGRASVLETIRFEFFFFRYVVKFPIFSKYTTHVYANIWYFVQVIPYLYSITLEVIFYFLLYSDV